ncbi:MAG: glycerate kinase, partial [Chloroflexi bacterium]|nr:glycerate kinase [Chloroflexota bacterium]
RRASTYGTGQLIATALDAGAREIIAGLGGSATNDGGAGALAALGARLLDGDGGDLPRVVIHLQRLARIDWSGLHPRLGQARLRAICDVTNPLLGPQGATAIYGPQKGVNTAMRRRIERSLEHWADVLESQLPSGRPGAAPAQALRDIPGAGAAGGLGFGLLALGATLEPGAEVVLDALHADEQLAWADLLITGEGRLDGQSLFGKASLTIARRARKAGVPALAITGGLEAGYEAAFEQGLDAVMPVVSRPMNLEEARRDAAELIQSATERAFRIMALGQPHAARTRRQ